MIDPSEFPCKVVMGGMSGCREGALANVLGASLAKKHRRYIGIVTEEEFLHDMNTLGNINVNNALVFVVFVKNKKKLIGDYAGTLNFEIFTLNAGENCFHYVKDILNYNNKSIVLVCEDK